MADSAEAAAGAVAVLYGRAAGLLPEAARATCRAAAPLALVHLLALAQLPPQVMRALVHCVASGAAPLCSSHDALAAAGRPPAAAAAAVVCRAARYEARAIANFVLAVSIAEQCSSWFVTLHVAIRQEAGGGGGGRGRPRVLFSPLLSTV
jgi:hypothetical protein